MYNSNFLPSLTTSDLLTLMTPLNTKSISDSFFSSSKFETLNGLNLCPTSFLAAEKPSDGDEEFKLKFKLPGYEKSEIKILVDTPQEKYFKNFKISVVADNNEEGSTKYQAHFPQWIDESTIKAELNKGILVITAKKDPNKNRKKEIPII